MANERSLLIKLLGDASGMKKALSEADDSVGKHDLSLKNLAGTIGSAYAAKQVIDFGKASVEAAAADEASQVTLATQLRNTTQASDEQIASVEAWITKTMFATNTADDVLRPALARLVTSTHDVGAAQDLMGVAIDTAQGKGISLETVVNALGRAHDGNVAALGRLGVATKDAEGKTLSFEGVVQSLADTFGGQAAAAADTQAGKLANMKLHYGELQEQIGTALMPVMEQLVGALSGVAKWFSSLDEGTQAWIVRIGLLGGGLVLATRAVNGIIGPLKSLGIIGKSAQTSIEGVEGATSKLSPTAVGAATALGGVGIALGAWEGLGAVAGNSLAFLQEKAQSLSTVMDEELNKTFLEAATAALGSARNTDSVSESIDKMVVANIDGSKRLLQYREDMGYADLMTNMLRESIDKTEAAIRQKKDTTERAAAATAAASVIAGAAKGAADNLAAATKAEETGFISITGVIDNMKAAQERANNLTHLAAQEMAAAETATNKMRTEFERLTGKLDADEAWLNLQQSVDDTIAGYSDLQTQIDSGAISAEAGARKQATAIIDLKQEVIAYGQQVGALPAEVETLLKMIDNGQIDEMETKLSHLARDRAIRLSITANGGVGASLGSAGGAAPAVPRASGGPVLAGGTYLIGEKGPELLQLGNRTGGNVIPNHALGGGDVTVIVNVHGSVMTERDLVRSVADGVLDAQRRGEFPGSFN